MKKIPELDLVRAFSMLCVILIHVTSGYVNLNSSFQLLNINFAFFLNQASRFAVPMFVMISGISLGLKSTPTVPVFSFYEGRLLKLLPPYLLWYSIYYLSNYSYQISALPHDNSFFSGLLLGNSAPHLYFIIVIAQCYLLYPLLRKLVTHCPWKCVFLSFLCTFTVQTLLFLRKFDLNLIPAFLRPFLWLLFPSWLFYFVLGLALNRERLDRIRISCAKNFYFLTGATLFFALLYTLESKATGDLGSIKTSLNFYVPLVFLSLFGLWTVLGRFPIFAKSIEFLSKHSMTVYFCHVLILTFFRKFSVFSGRMMGMVLLYFAVTLTSLAFAFLWDTLVSLCKRLLFRRSV